MEKKIKNTKRKNNNKLKVKKDTFILKQDFKTSPKEKVKEKISARPPLSSIQETRRKNIDELTKEVQGWGEEHDFEKRIEKINSLIKDTKEREGTHIDGPLSVVNTHNLNKKNQGPIKLNSIYNTATKTWTPLPNQDKSDIKFEDIPDKSVYDKISKTWITLDSVKNLFDSKEKFDIVSESSELLDKLESLHSSLESDKNVMVDKLDSKKEKVNIDDKLDLNLLKDLLSEKEVLSSKIDILEGKFCSLLQQSLKIRRELEFVKLELVEQYKKVTPLSNGKDSLLDIEALTKVLNSNLWHDKS